MTFLARRKKAIGLSIVFIAFFYSLSLFFLADIATFYEPYLHKQGSSSSSSTTSTSSTCNKPGFSKWRNLFFHKTAEDWAQEISGVEKSEYNAMWKEYIDKAPSWKSVKSRYSGKGIVVLAGNADTFKRSLLLLKVLKSYAVSLPIEVHYAGDELDEEMVGILNALGAHTNDLTLEHNIIPARVDKALHRSYHLKIAALINAKCSECLYLDSDNLPVKNPEYLFHTKQYKKLGAIFWPDFWKTEAENPIWEVIERPCEDEMEMESGQVLVNKAIVWRGLLLANYFGEQHDFYYKFVMGDKDLFRFAFKAIKQPYHMIQKWITLVGHAHDKNVLCGHSMLQHDPYGQPLFMHSNLVKLYSDELMEKVAVENGYPRNYAYFQYAKYKEDADPDFKFGLSFDYIKGVGCGGLLNSTKAPLQVGEVEDILPGFNERVAVAKRAVEAIGV